MTYPKLRAARTAGAAAVVLTGVMGLFAAHGAYADPSAPKSAAECRALSDFAARGACWDALDRQGLHDEQVVKKRNFGLGALGSRSPDAAIKLPKPEKTKSPKRVKPDNGEVDDLTLTIATVQDTPLGRILLTSTDGAVWEQVDGDPVNSRPSPGDTFEVRKKSMGGYMCSVSRWQSVRCQRDE